MPVESEQTVSIACDNQNCPGNDLDPADRTGWMFISSEVYGQPTQQHVFCCSDCVSASSELFESAPAAPAGPGAPA